jgi:hypothetical protein
MRGIHFAFAVAKCGLGSVHHTSIGGFDGLFPVFPSLVVLDFTRLAIVDSVLDSNSQYPRVYESY